jgi:hypothetical protein
MPAAATMVTQPMDGETVSDSVTEIKANLATLGNVDPGQCRSQERYHEDQRDGISSGHL